MICWPGKILPQHLWHYRETGHKNHISLGIPFLAHRCILLLQFWKMMCQIFPLPTSTHGSFVATNLKFSFFILHFFIFHFHNDWEILVWDFSCQVLPVRVELPVLKIVMFSRVLVFVDIFSCQHMSEIVRMAALHGAVKMAKPLTKWNALTLMNTLSICWAKKSTTSD